MKFINICIVFFVIVSLKQGNKTITAQGITESEIVWEKTLSRVDNKRTGFKTEDNNWHFI